MQRKTLSVSIATIFVALLSTAFARNAERPLDLPERLLSKPRNASDRPLSQHRGATRTVADTFVLAEFSFDASGAPDTQGWITVDATQQDTFFHVDDFVGLTAYRPLEGSQSMWCGARPDDPRVCHYATSPGYGNNWNQLFISVPFSIHGDVTLSYRVRWDSEYANYDPTYVSYLDVNGSWVYLPVDGGIGFYDWIGERSESFVIDAASIADTVQFRFRFSSDGAWSDEDGLWPTNGAVMIDSLTVTDARGVVDYQDFESEAVGARVTSDGHWQARPTQAYGDFGGLFSGTQVAQDDPCWQNPTGLWGFFDGSTADYACGGHPGQSAVPFFKPAEDYGELYIENEIWSPIIDYTKDINGIPVPATAGSALLEFDVYRDLPLDNLVFYTWYVRSVVDGCPRLWVNRNFVHWGEGRDWFRESREFADLIDPAATEIQVKLAVLDMCRYWCTLYGSGTCHSHAPLFDNVRVVRVDHTGPQWVVEGFERFQDNFAGDGTTTGTVRMDAARDILPPENPAIIPRDVATVTVAAPNVGLDSHLSGDPSSGPAVYIHVGDVSPVKSGAAVSDDLSRWPLVSSAGGWTVLRFDTLYNDADDPLEDRFCVDLNDDLYTPGDTVYYYYSARDLNGDVTYWSQASGVTDDEEWAQSQSMEVTCLPANALGGATDILYIDDFDGRGAEPFFMSAFAVLGLVPDRYDVLEPSANVSNGPGSRVVDVAQQLSAAYKKIIWNSGDLTAGLISDGTEATDKSDDFAMLLAFLDQNPDGAGLYVSGDHVASEWVSLSGAAAVDLRNSYMSFNLLGSDHISAGQPVSPSVVGRPGSFFEHAAGPDTLIAYAGCPYATFDVLEPSGTARLEMAYSNHPTLGAVASQATANTAGDTARVVLSGFSYHRIRDDRVQFPTDRVEHLLDILRWLDNAVADPTGIPITPLLTNNLAQNYPNPFNPVTSIRYSIESPARVNLRIYNAAGQLVRTLVGEEQQPRRTGFVVDWDGQTDGGTTVSSGVYFYTLVAGNFRQTKKMVLLK